MLTGEKYVDYNQAGSTLLFDIRKNNWSDKLFEINEISKDIFPPLIENGKFVGFLTKGNKKFLGINYDIPVCVGGHDAWCGLFALGIGISKKANDFFPSITGTAGTINIGEVIDREELDKTSTDFFYENYTWVIPHTYPGTYSCVDIVFDYYGALIEFAMRLFFKNRQKEVLKEDYLELEKSVNSAPPGANGVKIYVEENDFKKMRDLKGINFLNLKTSNSIGDISRAIMEYIGLLDRQHLEEIENKRNLKKKILVTGGLTKDKSFMQIRANILNREQYIYKEEEVNLLGAALLGGIGVGIYKDHMEAINSIGLLYKEVIKPELQIVEEYKKIFNLD